MLPIFMIIYEIWPNYELSKLCSNYIELYFFQMQFQTNCCGNFGSHSLIMMNQFKQADFIKNKISQSIGF